MRLPKEQFRALVNEVKQGVSILDIAEDAGIALRQEGACFKGFCPFHDDSATASFAIYDAKGTWRCFGACQDGGDVLDLYKRLYDVSFGDAVRELAERFGIAIPSGGSLVPPPRPNVRKTPARETDRDLEIPLPPVEPVDLSDLDQLWPYDRAEAVYVYPIRGGGEAHEVRYLDKGKKQSVLCRPTEWGLIYGLTAGEYYFSKRCWRRVNKKTPKDAKRKHIAAAQVGLYRPEVFRKARPGEDWVFCVEGPKDAEAAVELGLFATTSVNGASGLKEFQAEELRGYLVAVVGDHDTAGAQGAEKRAKMLRQVAREVRVLPPLGGEPGSGYDLSDFAGDRRRDGATNGEIAQALMDLVATGSCYREKAEIEVTTREMEVNDAALAAVARSERNVFHRGGSLVHVVRSAGKKGRIHRPIGSPVIRPIQEGKLREILAFHCRFVKITRGNGEEKKTPVHPPQWSTRALLARGEWEGVEHLEAVIEGPVIRADGTILQEPGFDPTTGLYYLPSADYEKVPDYPDGEEVREALQLLTEVVCDFPFKAPEHFASWLSALLTPLARFAFSGPSPLNLIDANTRGAGKSLLADVCNMIVTGRPAARMSYNSRDETELRKAITSLAMNGDQIVLIDNIRGYLGDATLDRALTATTWKDRLLGSNVAVELPLDVTWYATGNNVTLMADTARRVLHVRLESPEERPEERTGFRHPNLLGWIARERRRILPAALTLLRAWWVAGQPQRELPGFGSFEDWSKTVRQCVVWLGLADPVETRMDLEDAADMEASALNSLVLGLEELLENPLLLGQATAGEIHRILEERADEKEHRDLMEAFHELVPRLKPGQVPTTRQLGHLLRKHRGKWIDGACLTAAKEKTRGGIAWMVRRKDEGDGPSPESVDSSGDLKTPSPPSPPSPPPSKSGQKCDGGDEGDGSHSLRGNGGEELRTGKGAFPRKGVGPSPSSPPSPGQDDPLEEVDEEDPAGRGKVTDDRPPF